MKVQLEQICPLLGTRVDPNMHFGYPTLENHCYAHNRVSPLTLEEQATLCLSGNYPTCRFYLAHQSRYLATQKAEESLARVSTPPKPYRPGPLAIIVTGVILLGICGGLILLSGVPQALVYAVIPTTTPTQTKVPTRTPTLTLAPPTETPRPPTQTPTATATVPASPTPTYYVVQAGDVLSNIAAKYGVSVQAIMDANGITDPRLVRVGTRLIIPPPNATPAAPQRTPTR